MQIRFITLSSLELQSSLMLPISQVSFLRSLWDFQKIFLIFSCFLGYCCFFFSDSLFLRDKGQEGREEVNFLGGQQF